MRKLSVDAVKERLVDRDHGKIVMKLLLAVSMGLLVAEIAVVINTMASRRNMDLIYALLTRVILLSSCIVDFRMSMIMRLRLEWVCPEFLLCSLALATIHIGSIVYLWHQEHNDAYHTSKPMMTVIVLMSMVILLNKLLVNENDRITYSRERESEMYSDGDRKYSKSDLVKMNNVYFLKRKTVLGLCLLVVITLQLFAAIRTEDSSELLTSINVSLMTLHELFAMKEILQAETVGEESLDHRSIEIFGINLVDHGVIASLTVLSSNVAALLLAPDQF